MINLLTKIEQNYGLSVAISLAKQAIEQNTTLVRELKTHKSKIIESRIIPRLFAWSLTKEGQKYCSNISTALNEEYSISYNDLENYAKDTMQKILKEPKIVMIAPFNKGSLNIKGIIHQAAKGIKDDRPFVVALINEELERVKTIIKNSPRDTFNYEGYDIRVHHLKNLILESKTTIEAVEDFKITPLLAIRFYEFEKLIKNPLDCSWIKSYLTQENMQKQSVPLFKSNKMSIKLENGRVSLVDFKTYRDYNTPVLYDKTKNEFYL